MQSSLVNVAGWIKNSFIDYPGRIAAVLFFRGCNLCCPYCHNPHISLDDPDLPSTDTPQRILDYLHKRAGTINGIVCSGGEPTLHAGLTADIETFKALGYRVKLDTNGLLPERIESFRPDYLALDIKGVPKVYPEKLGAPYVDCADRLGRSLEYLKAMGEHGEIRITAAPALINERTIRSIGEMINGAHRVFLQQLQLNVPLLDPGYNNVQPRSARDLERLRCICAEYVGECVVRNVKDKQG